MSAAASSEVPATPLALDRVAPLVAPDGVLSLERLAVRFGDRVGLPDISLDVRSGERLALLGPSGSGKSSLLRTIAGLDAGAGGRIVVQGRDVTTSDASERRLVYLHQSPLLFTHLTVLDNVAFPLEVRGVARAAARDRARELLQRVQLEPLADRRPASLSGGQRHRVALARALAAEPAVLLLDEPFAALDPALRGEVRAAVEGILDTRALAAILVTHDVDEAAAFADRVAVLLDGRIVQLATPDALLRRPATEEVARFLGIANLVPGHRDEGGWFRCVLGAARIPGECGAAWLVARPDALVLSPSASVDAVGHVVRCEERVGGTVWHVDAGTTSFVGVAAPGGSLAVGDAVAVDVRWDRAHVVSRAHGGGHDV